MAIDIEAPGADEADLKAAIQALANDVTVVTLSANTTLDSTYYGKIVFVTNASVVITFPAAPASVEVLRVYNGSAGNITVNGVIIGAGRDILFISVSSAWNRFQPTVSAGGTLLPTPRTGQRTFPRLGPIAAGTALTAGRIAFEPFCLPYDLTVDQVAVEVATAAGANLGVAFYADVFSSTTHRPDGAPLIAGSATVNPGTTGWKPVSLNSNYTFLQGVIYWAAFCSDGATALRTITGSNRAALVGATFSGGMPTGIWGASTWASQSSSNTPGTWPTSPSLSPSGNENGIVGLRSV